MSLRSSFTLPEGRRRRRPPWRRSALTLVVAGAIAGGTVVGVLQARGGGEAAPTPPIDAAPSPASLEQDAGATTAQAELDTGPPPNATVSLAAVGDIVMGTTAYGLPPDGGRRFFDGVDQDLRGDIVLGNLEGTLSTGPSSKCGSGSTGCFAFQTPPSYVKWLERAGFTVLNLANNHAFDYGPSGLQQTIQALRRAGLRLTGRPGQITVIEIDGVRVALIGFASYPWANDLTDIATAKRLVRKASKRADLVVVTFHGGAEGVDHQHVSLGVEEYLGENRGDIIRLSHAVVDAGADLVVGHGPHVLRGMEWYHDRLIAYSMGNFAGYGAFNLSGALSVSGILRVTLRADGTFVRGRLVATSLVGEGVPVLDLSQRAHGLVRELSRSDFGQRGMRVSGTGVLRPPAR